MMHKKFQMSSMGELTFFLELQVKQKEDGIFISQDKYVTEILKKFGFTNVKTASTPMEIQKPLLKYKDGEEVDVHLYRSMIGSLMYLTSSRPDIMFAVCACARYQVNPKVSHLHAVKRIFRYLKGQPKLGIWYPKDLPFDLVAYTDSDYARASLDRKSTTGGCQFLGCRLISWQCKKQIVVANSTTEAEYVAASSCCGQVLWIQNQFLDYGTELVEGSEVRAEGSETREESSSKRAGDELQQQNAKKWKVDDDQEVTKMKELMKIFPDEEEVAVDAIPLATKPPSIMFRSFDKEDLETLWKLVKAKHEYTRPEEGYERVLWGDLKTMFEHNVENAVWRNLQENKVLVWKLFDSCGVHFV
ncbi:uncharacterized mitochondrial protein-like protein, partial [Tanacetum coccineum]